MSRGYALVFQEFGNTIRGVVGIELTVEECFSGKRNLPHLIAIHLLLFNSDVSLCFHPIH